MACGCVDKVEKNTLDFLKEKHKDREYEEVSGWGGDWIAKCWFFIKLKWR